MTDGWQEKLRMRVLLVIGEGHEQHFSSTLREIAGIIAGF